MEWGVSGLHDSLRLGICNFNFGLFKKCLQAERLLVSFRLTLRYDFACFVERGMCFASSKRKKVNQSPPTLRRALNLELSGLLGEDYEVWEQ